MSGAISPLPNMSLRHAQGQRYSHLHQLLQYYKDPVACEFLELLLKLATGVEWDIPPAEETSQHKFTDWRSTVVF